MTPEACASCPAAQPYLPKRSELYSSPWSTLILWTDSKGLHEAGLDIEVGGVPKSFAQSMSRSCSHTLDRSKRSDLHCANIPQRLCS